MVFDVILTSQPIWKLNQLLFSCKIRFFKLKCLGVLSKISYRGSVSKYQGLLPSPYTYPSPHSSLPHPAPLEVGSP